MAIGRENRGERKEFGGRLRRRRSEGGKWITMNQERKKGR